MGHPQGVDTTELKARAKRLRECARQARALAGRLGPYLDQAVKKATPRGTGPGSGAIWLGPFADQCTLTLQKRRNTLSVMATSLLGDARRWEQQADELDHQATEKDKAAAGGH
ncbi:hypothetical protein AB0C59_01455 [Streptomyces sp. NPDC048664]|uniref:hypothetical protein n=1 Tax=Streptomyces sp. NPDC048664 TaxID=3154505 RepID=UPI0034293F4E